MSNTTVPVLPPGYALGSYWYYAPNKAAPIVFAILFTLSGLTHVYQCFHYNAWKVAGLLPWAASLFVAGFILREVGAYQYSNLNVFIASTSMLISAPPVYEAANYFLLGRILYYIPYHAPLHPGRVVITFTALQAIVEAFNGNGAWRATDGSLSTSQQNIGKGLIKTALILQLFSMVAFVSIAFRFQYTCERAGLLNKKLKTMLNTLYISCTLITARTIYRCVEYWEELTINVDNYSSFPPVLRQEWFFWVFEASLMISNTVLLNIMFPLKYMPKNRKIFLATDGVTEVEGPGLDDRRHWLVSMLDPFDLHGWITGKSKNDEKFWEAPHGDADKGTDLIDMSKGNDSSKDPTNVV